MINTSKIDYECLQEEKTFSVLLYDVIRMIFRNYRQNSWLGQSVKKLNFDPGGPLCSSLSMEFAYPR